jgi:hypothetical protein
MKMKRAELERVVLNVATRIGEGWNAMELDEFAMAAAAGAFARNLPEDEDTRKLRWQVGDLMVNGEFTLED